MIRVKMTTGEVREAIKAWLDEHGVPSNGFAIKASVRPPGQAYLNTGAAEAIEVTIDTEAPHMGGPYR